MKALHLVLLVAVSELTAQSQVLSIDTFDDGTFAPGQNEFLINARLLDTVYIGASMINGVRVLVTSISGVDGSLVDRPLSVASGVLSVCCGSAPPKELVYYPNLNLDVTGYPVFSVKISSVPESSNLGVVLFKVWILAELEQ